MTAPSLLTSHQLFGPHLAWTPWTVFSGWENGAWVVLWQTENLPTAGCLSHSTLSPSLFGLVFFFFFLVIKTSSSFQTPYTQLGVSVYTGRQGFMSQRHTRSLGAATNRCRKCPLWPVYHPSAREQCWGCNPLKGWVCVLRGECYRAESRKWKKVLFFFLQVCSSIYLLQWGKVHYLALAVWRLLPNA